MTADTTQGAFLAVWTDTVTDTAATPSEFPRIVGRRVSAEGKLLDSAFVVSQRSSGNGALGGNRPAAAYNPDAREYLVLYDRDYTGSAQPGLYGQRILGSGELAGDEFPVSLGAGQRAPVLAYDSRSGGYMTVWTTQAGLAGVKLGDSGTPIGVIANLGGAGAANPALAFDSINDRFLLVFDAPSGNGRAIFGQLLTNDGQAFGSAIAISTASGTHLRPAVAFSRDSSRSVVVWEETRSGGSALDAQIVDVAGALSGPNTLLLEGGSARESLIRVRRSVFLSPGWVISIAMAAAWFFGRSMRPTLTFAGIRVVLSDSSLAQGSVLAINAGAGVALAGWSEASGMRGQVVDVSENAARLTVAQSISPVPARLGEPLQFRIQITNPGPARAKSVVLEDTLPDGIVYGSATPEAGECSFTAPTLNCKLGDIAVGAKVSVVVAATPATLGRVVSRAKVTWSNGGTGASAKVANAGVRIRYPGSLSLIAPGAGEHLPAGERYGVRWDISGGNPDDSLNFRLRYSINGGASWSLLAAGLRGRIYDWVVQPPPRNARAKLEVVGFTADGKRIGRDVSDGQFNIDVLTVNSPNGGETLQAGSTTAVTWTTFGTRATVARTILSYAAGGRFRTIAALDGNPGSFQWQVPAPSGAGQRAKLRISLRDAAGREVGRDLSDAPFSIVR